MNVKYVTLEFNYTDSAEGRNAMTNYDDFMDTLNRMKKVQPVSDHLRKAAFYHRQKNKFFEKNALSNLLCEIKDNNINDEDLRIAKLQDYTTGTILTIGQRLTALGWKG